MSLREGHDEVTSYELSIRHWLLNEKIFCETGTKKDALLLMVAEMKFNTKRSEPANTP